MRNSKFHFIAVIAFLACSPLFAQQTAKLSSTGIGYMEYLPQGYNSTTSKYPVVISLHGIKEKGNTLADVIKVANVGLPKYVKEGQQYPFILISPQLKTSMGRWTGAYVMEVLNYVKTKLRIDNSRIYLTGLSLGGGGVWSVSTAYPSVFAAILPICSGYNNLGGADELAAENVATWGFHGEEDGTVSYTVTQKMINAINGCTPKPNPLAKFTIFPGMSHAIWNKVYKETSALTWLLTFKNGSTSTTPTNDAPVVNAGSDKSITLPTNSVALQASASDSDGSIISYVWTKVSGSTVSLANTTTSKLSASNMVAGTYSFRVTAKDNDGATDYDDVKVVVQSTSTTLNKAPVVSAGSDKTTSNKGITIVGTASDPDGQIVSYHWTKVSGANVYMNNTSTPKLWASGLTAGTYYFRLTVKDNGGLVKTDDMKLIVQSALVSNTPPTVSAGSDKITSNNGITIVGSASDTDGSIVSYHWTKVSGPSVPLSNTSTTKLWVSKLISGTYYFRLTVKDNQGAVRSDDMKLTVPAG